MERRPEALARTICPLALTLFLLCLAGGAAAQEAATPPAGGEGSLGGPVEAAVRTAALYLSLAIEAAAALVIGVTSARAVWGYGRNLARGQERIEEDRIRVRLGRSLTLALEFLLAADILRTAVAPTWNEIGQLVVIAALRTALNYFLERELQATEQRDPETKLAGEAAPAAERP